MDNNPSGFDAIFGQERPVEVLRKALRTGRIHHAYLFTGPSGVGKGTLARVFARALNCPRANPDPCGTCSTCTRIEREEHPDVTILTPDTSKARPTIKIDAVREITRQVHYKPYEAARRVIVIEDAETMTEEGANALLKTLEEPTGETLFVLVTSQIRLLLTTIRSRCQTLRFAPLERAAIQHFLEQRGTPSEKAALASAFSHGSLGEAIRLSKDEDGLSEQRGLINDICDLEPGDSLGIAAAANRCVSKGSQEQRVLLDALRVFYRDVVLFHSGAAQDRMINVDRLKDIQRIAGQLTLDTAIGHIERIDEAQRDLLRYIDARLVMENLLISLLATR